MEVLEDFACISKNVIKFANANVLRFEKQNTTYHESKLKGIRPVVFICIYFTRFVTAYI